MCWT